ncbi:hypothetical protein SteCoe_340 [Stentor coeruleus]|uniref:Uncharacterized protein n=1 Tax=Stentor coeruleus TaxID=5963 RepID=A0A1R2D4H5_9CILI|nr:hypothetical protein SteCoe_340 [Stentor coeruleus]
MLKRVSEGNLLGDVVDIQVKKSFWWTVKKIMNPPIYATLASIPLALIPFLKQYVFCESGAILADNVFSALVTVGKTASPLICVLLGQILVKDTLQQLI